MKQVPGRNFLKSNLLKMPMQDLYTYQEKIIATSAEFFSKSFAEFPLRLLFPVDSNYPRFITGVNSILGRLFWVKSGSCAIRILQEAVVKTISGF